MTFSRPIIYPAWVTGSSSISRQQISFAIAGVIFGTLLGFVAAHQLYGGRFAGAVAANVPETMGGQRPSPPVGGASQDAAAPTGPAAQGEAAPPMAMMEQVKKELEALKSTLETNPRDVVALARLGNLYMDAGMYDRAHEFYRGALDVEPANVEIRTDMGTCLRQMGKSREALQQFQDSVARDPKHWKGWFNIGVVSMYDLGEYHQAEAAFTKVLELNPGSFDIDAVRAEIEKIKSQKAGKGGGYTPS